MQIVIWRVEQKQFFLDEVHVCTSLIDQSLHWIYVSLRIIGPSNSNWLFWGPYPRYTGSSPSIGDSKILRVVLLNNGLLDIQDWPPHFRGFPLTHNDRRRRGWKDHPRLRNAGTFERKKAWTACGSNKNQPNVNANPEKLMSDLVNGGVPFLEGLRKIEVFPKKGGTPKWMVYNGKPYKMDDLGVPLFLETSIHWKHWKSLQKTESCTDKPETDRFFVSDMYGRNGHVARNGEVVADNDLSLIFWVGFLNLCSYGVFL